VAGIERGCFRTEGHIAILAKDVPQQVRPPFPLPQLCQILLSLSDVKIPDFARNPVGFSHNTVKKWKKWSIRAFNGVIWVHPLLGFLGGERRSRQGAPHVKKPDRELGMPMDIPEGIIPP
jgi:hypothetical protein